jgi:hypothetical protein
MAEDFRACMEFDAEDWIENEEVTLTLMEARSIMPELFDFIVDLWS